MRRSLQQSGFYLIVLALGQGKDQTILTRSIKGHITLKMNRKISP